MTALASQPSASMAPVAPVNPDTTAYLDFLFGEQAGWLCAGYIDGDPSIPKDQPGHSPLREKWFDWPRQRHDALICLGLHDEQGHNIYMRQCLFSEKSGTLSNALPSRIIWQDDVTDPHKVCSILIQTSPAHYQAIIRLDRLATTVERQRLAATWRAESKDSEDAQNASKDVVHHIRVPGGHNSKGHGWHLVTYAQRSERTYSTDKLLARCGETHPSCSSGGISKARAEQHQADAWSVLQDGATLFHSKRWQAIIAGRPQLRQQLVERQRVIIYNKNGEPDDSTSAQRAVFVQNTITAWSDKNPGHLPEDEIRAVAMFLKPMLGRGKTVAQYQTDIDCLIVRYQPKNYRPVATHCVHGKAQPINVAALPASVARPCGRPRATSQLDRVRAILWDLPTDAAGAIHLNTKLIAAQMAKSPRQVRNYLTNLEKQGEIKYLSRGTGRSLAILLTNSFQTPKAQPARASDKPAEREIKSARDLPTQGPVLPTETPQTAHDSGAPHGETRILERSVFLHVRAGAKNSASLDDLAAWWEAQQPVPADDWGNPAERRALADEFLAAGNVGAAWWVFGIATASSAPRVPTLADAVAEAFDAYTDRPLIPRKKGKPRRAPLTRRMVETYVTSNYPALGFTDADLGAAIDDERFRRKLADIPTMSTRTLQAEIRHAEHLIDKSHEAGDQAWRWWVIYRNAARAELAQRPPAPNRPKGGRKPCEVIPDPREVAAARQADFWAMADIALADMRGESYEQMDRTHEANHTAGCGSRAGSRTPVQSAAAPRVCRSGPFVFLRYADGATSAPYRSEEEARIAAGLVPASGATSEPRLRGGSDGNARVFHPPRS